MERKGHGTIKKSKAYGAIGTLLLSGVLIATLGAASVSADETTVTVENDTTELVADSSATEAENNEVVTETEADVDKEASQEAVTVDDDQETVSEDNQADVQGQEVADTTTDSETPETNSSGSVESSQTTTEAEVSDSEVTDQTEDKAADTQDSAQTDEQLATVEEATDNETVERGATGSATDEVTSVSLASNGFNLQYNQAIASGSKIMFAVWSDVNGQDDLIWYTADSNGKATAKYTGSYGKYNVHTYQNLNGKMTGLNGTTIDVPKPSAKVSITKASATTYKVTVTDVPVYITSVTLPTWTENKSQDDIIWYKTTKDSSTTYSATISVAEHNLESGKYNVHVYGTSEVTHSFVALSGSDGIDLIFNQSLSKPTVTVQNHNAANGTLQVVIAETETSKDVASVSVAAWSDPNQKNIHWYTSSKVSNGKVVITVDEKYHHNLSADYTIHVYVKTKDGETIGYNLGQYVLNNKQTTASVSTTYKGTGVYSVNVSGVYSSGTVKYAVWSDTNGQDDIKWYDATTSGTSASGLINVANHSGTGTYHLHVYQSDNGQMYFLTSTDFTVKRTNYSTPYYNQRDGRWANTRYGYYKMASTGCVPTSLAMVFSSLTGNEVLPTTVASYLYNNTVEFNRGGEGTTGNGVLVASRQWSLTPTVINSSVALTSALQEGHHVVAAVQQDKFSPWGWGTSHEIVLKGYSNGNTYVSDPYNASNNGWYPIVSLWNEQSTQWGDISGLGNPFVKITDI